MAAKDPRLRREVRHDLCMNDVIRFADYISIKDIQNESLRPAWHTFQNNIDTVVDMVNLPLAMVSDAVDYLVPLSEAIFNVAGKPVLEDNENDQGTVDAIGSEFTRISHNFFATKQRSKVMYFSGLWKRIAISMSSAFPTTSGLFALLEAQIIGTWTTFNTLTTDLLITTVNERPRILDKLGKKQIDLATLLDAGEDQNWNGRMGELARLFFQFDSFQSTKEAYKKLFDDRTINETLDRPIVRVGCLIRNQCIHDAGIATGNFVKQAAELKIDPWQDVKAGELLPINGKDSATIVEGIVECANDLVRALDSWLRPPAGQVSKLPSQTP